MSSVVPPSLPPYLHAGEFALQFLDFGPCLLGLSLRLAPSPLHMHIIRDAGMVSSMPRPFSHHHQQAADLCSLPYDYSRLVLPMKKP